MKSVIVGASAGLGRALAEELAARGHALFLAASDAADLAALAADLRLVHGVAVEWAALDLARPDLDGAAVRDEVLSRIGPPDNLFLIAGYSRAAADRGPVEGDLLQTLLTVNFVSPTKIANAFLPVLENNPRANIVGAGSVAGARPRRKNALYAAAKSGLEAYFGSLRHYLPAGGCKVQFYRLGYIDTQMSFGEKRPFPKLAPEAAAKAILANLGRDMGMRYLPGWWRWIMLVFRMLPWPLFRRIEG